MSIKVSLSFDDGRGDNFTNAKKILDKYGLKATFNIASAYVDGSISEKNRPCPNKALTVHEVSVLHDEGHEIAGHGCEHLNTIDDIEKGFQAIRGWLNINDECNLGFASPESNIDGRTLSILFGERLKKKVKYVRVGVCDNSVFTRIIRKLAHMTGNAFLYEKSFNKSLLGDDIFYLTSIPILHNTTVKQIKKLIEYAVNNDKNCILMFHSILHSNEEYYENIWSWDIDNFDELCKYLCTFQKKGILSVTTTNKIIGNKGEIFY